MATPEVSVTPPMKRMVYRHRKPWIPKHMEKRDSFHPPVKRIGPRAGMPATHRPSPRQETGRSRSRVGNVELKDGIGRIAKRCRSSLRREWTEPGSNRRPKDFQSASHQKTL